MRTESRVAECKVVTRSEEVCDNGMAEDVAARKVKESLGCESFYLMRGGERKSLKCRLVDMAVGRLSGTKFFKSAVSWICHWKMDSHTVTKNGDTTYYRKSADVAKECLGTKRKK